MIRSVRNSETTPPYGELKTKPLKPKRGSLEVRHTTPQKPPPREITALILAFPRVLIHQHPRTLLLSFKCIPESRHRKEPGQWVRTTSKYIEKKALITEL